MKIAIPTRENYVDDHFGHCEFYTIYTVDEKSSINNKELLSSPQGCGCRSNIAAILQQMNVTLMLAGNMGEGAYNMLNQFGMQVIRGCSGKTDDVLKKYLNGEIKDLNMNCSQHQHDHDCNK